MSEEEVKKEESKKEKTPEKKIAPLLLAREDAPPQEIIDGWKALHGAVFVSGFSEKELFVFRPIMRGEWKALHADLAREEEVTEFTVQERVCDLCVLWPEQFDFSKCKGGTAATLYEQVMQKSHFVSPAAASMLIEEL